MQLTKLASGGNVVTTTITKRDVQLFVAGLLEEGSQKDALRAELKIPASPVNQYLAQLALDAKQALHLNWTQLLLRETMCHFENFRNCVATQIQNPNPMHRRWIFYWYVCGRRYYQNAGQIAKNFTHADWDQLLRTMIQLYQEALLRIPQLPENMAERYRLYHAILSIQHQLRQLRARHHIRSLENPAFLLDVMDVFFQWDSAWNDFDIQPSQPAFQKLHAYTFAYAANFLSSEELQQFWQDLLSAIAHCLA